METCRNNLMRRSTSLKTMKTKKAKVKKTTKNATLIFEVQIVAPRLLVAQDEVAEVEVKQVAAELQLHAAEQELVEDDLGNNQLVEMETRMITMNKQKTLVKSIAGKMISRWKPTITSSVSSSWYLHHCKPANPMLTVTFTAIDAVKDPRAALEATAEDWLENYRSDEDTRGQALADLVNFVLRVGLLLYAPLHLLRKYLFADIVLWL